MGRKIISLSAIFFGSIVLICFLFSGQVESAVDSFNNWLSNRTEQTTINDSDYFPIVDYTGPTTKKATFASVKSNAETYFDTQYEEINAVSTHNSSSTAHDSSAWASCTPTITCVGGSGNTAPVFNVSICRYRREFGSYHVKLVLSIAGGTAGAGTGVMHVALPEAADSSNDGSYIHPALISLGYVGGVYPGSASIASSATTFSFTYTYTSSGLIDLTCGAVNDVYEGVSIDLWYE